MVEVVNHETNLYYKNTPMIIKITACPITASGPEDPERRAVGESMSVGSLLAEYEMMVADAGAVDVAAGVEVATSSAEGFTVGAIVGSKISAIGNLEGPNVGRVDDGVAVSSLDVGLPEGTGVVLVAVGGDVDCMGLHEGSNVVAIAVGGDVGLKGEEGARNVPRLQPHSASPATTCSMAIIPLCI